MPLEYGVRRSLMHSHQIILTGGQLVITSDSGQNYVLLAYITSLRSATDLIVPALMRLGFIYVCAGCLLHSHFSFSYPGEPFDLWSWTHTAQGHYLLTTILNIQFVVRNYWFLESWLRNQLYERWAETPNSLTWLEWTPAVSRVMELMDSSLVALGTGSIGLCLLFGIASNNLGFDIREKLNGLSVLRTWTGRIWFYIFDHSPASWYVKFGPTS